MPETIDLDQSNISESQILHTLANIVDKLNKLVNNPDDIPLSEFPKYLETVNSIKDSYSELKQIELFNDVNIVKDQVDIVDALKTNIDNLILDVNSKLSNGGFNAKTNYELALDSGFVGTLQEYLNSLKGDKLTFSDLTQSDKDSLKGLDAKTNYELALVNGFVGTEQEYLNSLKGDKLTFIDLTQSDKDSLKGLDAKTNYELALDSGFVGTEQEYLNSLKGDKLTFSDLTQSDKDSLKGADAPSSFIVGEIKTVSFSTVPDGFFECNGAEVSRVDFSSLYDAIGLTYGDGDGASTFNLPDLRGEFIRGWDNGRGVDSNRELGTFQNDDFKSHNHYINALRRNGGISSGTGTYSANNPATVVSNSDSRGGSETRPRNISMMYIIKH